MAPTSKGALLIIDCNYLSNLCSFLQPEKGDYKVIQNRLLFCLILDVGCNHVYFSNVICC